MTYFLFTENIIKISPAMAESPKFPQLSGIRRLREFVFSSPLDHVSKGEYT